MTHQNLSLGMCWKLFFSHLQKRAEIMPKKLVLQMGVTDKTERQYFGARQSTYDKMKSIQ